MLNKEEFRREVHRRAEETLTKNRKKQKRMEKILASAACFSVVISVVLYAGNALDTTNKAAECSDKGSAVKDTRPYNTSDNDAAQTSGTKESQETCDSPSDDIKATTTRNDSIADTTLSTTSNEVPPVHTAPKDILSGEIMYEKTALPMGTVTIQFHTYEAFTESEYYIEDILRSGAFETNNVYYVRFTDTEISSVILLRDSDGMEYKHTLQPTYGDGNLYYYSYILICNRSVTSIVILP